MKKALFVIIISTAFAQAPEFKEVICWNKAGKQILKENAQKVFVKSDKVEVYKKESNNKPDFIVVDSSCVIKKL